MRLAAPRTVHCGTVCDTPKTGYIPDRLDVLDILSEPRTVNPMTTTTEFLRTWMPTLVIARFARAAQVITAEYHMPTTEFDHSMHYSLHVEGGRNHGIVIHCKTEVSVLRLFNEVVALHHLGITHPYLLPL